MRPILRAMALAGVLTVGSGLGIGAGLAEAQGTPKDASSAPQPPSATSSEPSARFQAELKKTMDLRRADRELKAQRQAQRQAEREAWFRQMMEREQYLGLARAQVQIEAARAQAERGQARGIEMMGRAAMANAQTNRAYYYSGSQGTSPLYYGTYGPNPSPPVVIQPPSTPSTSPSTSSTSPSSGGSGGSTPSSSPNSSSSRGDQVHGGTHVPGLGVVRNIP